MFKSVGFLTFLVLAAPPMKAQDFSHFIDGNDLWTACQSDRPFAYGVVAGIHDALSEAFSKTGDRTLQVCVPTGTTIPMIKKTVCEDLAEHANLRDMSAVQVVWSSMLVSYPCP